MFKLVGDKVIFYELFRDPYPENPLKDFDGYGTIWSFSTKHINYKNPQEIECHPDRVGLSYYEHGQCRWFVRDELQPPDMQWDGVRHAGIWEPDEALRYEVKGLDDKARRKKMVEFASQACKIYSDWCNGEVYEARYKVYPVKKTEDGQVLREEHYYCDEDCEEEDVMGNCFGSEGVDEAQKMLKEVFEKHGVDIGEVEVAV